MERARLRKPSVSQGENTRPGDRVFLAAAAKCLPPMPNHSFPEYAETVKVPRHRIVVEVALHDRFEPLAGLAGDRSIGSAMNSVMKIGQSIL